MDSILVTSHRSGHKLQIHYFVYCGGGGGEDFILCLFFVFCFGGVIISCYCLAVYSLIIGGWYGGCSFVDGGCILASVSCHDNTLIPICAPVRNKA